MVFSIDGVQRCIGSNEDGWTKIGNIKVKCLTCKTIGINPKWVVRKWAWKNDHGYHNFETFEATTKTPCISTYP